MARLPTAPTEHFYDPLAAPNREFDWGPERVRGLRRKDRHDHPDTAVGANEAQPLIAAFVPPLLVGLGAALLVIGSAFAWLSTQPAAAQSPLAEASLITATQPTAQHLDQQLPATVVADAEEPTIVVHLSGAVARPGIVEVPVDARVFHALDAAGGASLTADLDRLNLAAPLTDGSQLHVPEVEVASTEPADPNTSISEQMPTLSGTPGDEPATASDAATTPSFDPDVAQTVGLPDTAASVAAPTATASSEDQAPSAPSLDEESSTDGDTSISPEQGALPPDIEEQIYDPETAPSADLIDELVEDHLLENQP